MKRLAETTIRGLNKFYSTKPHYYHLKQLQTFTEKFKINSSKTRKKKQSGQPEVDHNASMTIR